MEPMKLFQTVNYLLKKYDGRLNYTKLIKELYLADRKSLSETGRSISEDNYYCMKFGPVLENLYSLISGNYNEKDVQSQWNAYFVKDGFDLVSMVEKLPEGDLCRYEKRVLDEIDSLYHDKTYQQMIDIVHDTNICPEWSAPEGNKSPLEKEKILSAIGYNPEQISNILEEDSIYLNDKLIFEKLKTESL